ncbi:hydrolase CocE/NonD family protein [Nitratireductor pacificus pht-3B]|uniref:Hydrolase CocE/NonD family protein n=2 Tax=Nitratireductor TaxID=245876 RepID=K2MT31_9HYPH|nr:hydrolase CocE/NonD family protein [Nitratireductor pacificus pht-3B]
MIPMRDGVRLATDIYRPGRDGKAAHDPLPVIFERTPYDKAGTPRTELSLRDPVPASREELAIRLVREGYVVIWQDCRGRYRSEGTFTKYLNEGEDGFDAMVWIKAQPWNNGRIGTMGLSYDAHTQMAMACLNPPGLSCMAVDSGGFSNAFTCGIRQGGAFELKQATWAYNRAMEAPLAEKNPLIRAAIQAEDLHGWFGKMPWTKGRSPVKWDPDYEAYLLDQWQNGTFDEFWKKVGIWAAGYYDRMDTVPAILMSSWYDAYVHTTLENYQGLKTHGRPLILIMGCWTHGNRSQRVFGDVDFGPAAPFDGQVDTDWLTFRLRWFERWLKQSLEPEPVLETPVHYFLMGGGGGAKTADGHMMHGGAWRRSSDWPPREAAPVRYFLHADMELSRIPPAMENQHLAYDFDPRNPVPTIGGSLTSGEPIFSGGGFDQVERPEFYGCLNPGMPLTARRDVVSFQTPPLEEDVIVAGPVTVRLNVSTDAPDTDFTAKLVDVYPPSEDYPRGYALNVTDGIFRLRYRHSFEKPELVRPEEGVMEIEITPFATANRFCKGHCIRVDISSSNFPKYDVNPNTGGPEGTSRIANIARNRIHLDATHRSYVELYCLPD